MVKQPERIRVDVDGQEVELSNLDKVLYPAAGFTKGEVIHYYTQIGPVLLPRVTMAASRVEACVCPAGGAPPSAQFE